MEQNLLPLVLMSQQSRRWSTRVMVLEKTGSRRSKATGNTFKRFIFIDKDGTKIQGICYGQDIDTVDRVLQLHHSYIVSNARITNCPAAHRLVDNTIQWVLCGSTAMECDSEGALPTSLGSPNFTPFTRFEEYKGTTTNIDILGIVIDMSVPRSVTSQHWTATVQDFVLVSHEKIPVVLSLWNEFIESEGATVMAAIRNSNTFPLIAALRVRVVQAFRGLSLSVKGFANIMVNPPYSSADPLQTWAMANEEYLQSIIAKKTYFTGVNDMCSSSNNTITTVAAVINTGMDGHFTVEAHVSLINESQPFYYMACPTCKKSTTATEEQEYTCHICNQKTVATPRARYIIMVYDELTQLDVVSFGEIAEQLLGITAADFLAHSSAGTHANIAATNDNLATTKFKLNIQKKQNINQQEIRYYYKLVAFSPLPDILSGTEQPTVSASSTQSIPIVSTPAAREYNSAKRDSPVIPELSTATAPSTGKGLTSQRFLQRLAETSDDATTSKQGN